MTKTEQTLIQLAARRFNADVSSLHAGDDFYEKLHIDSIQAADLLTEIEMEMDVEIPDYELQGVKTFAALAAVIDKRR